MIITAAKLTEFISQILVQMGTERAHADICSTHLVAANLKGHDSHGVGMIPSYVRAIKAGLTFPNRHAEVVRDRGAVLLVDGAFGLGQVVAREAIDRGIARARETGVVCLGLRNACHIGRIGTYGEQCAEAGMVSVHFVNVVGHGPSVVPFGGREPRMVTNPFCCTVPRPDRRHIVLDMATSNIAIGKIRVAWMKGVEVPEGSLIDHEGRPTNDPNAFFGPEPRGHLLAFGQHKGSGLMTMCELLGGGLAAQWTMQPASNRDYGATVNNMLSFIIDPDAFGNREGFEREVTGMIDYIRATRPADGTDRVRVPGDPERETFAKRMANGIDIDDNSWEGLEKSANIAGLSAAQIAALTR